MLKKYNFKDHYRYKQADKYIATYNSQKVKTYIDFCNKPKQVDKIHLYLSDEQQKYISSTHHYESKRTAWNQKARMAPFRDDDFELQYPIDKKTLIGFMKQGIKQRKPHQLLFFNIVFCSTLCTFLFFYWWFRSPKTVHNTVQIFNPEYMERYGPVNIQHYIKEYKRKMGIHLHELNQFGQLQ